MLIRNYRNRPPSQRQLHQPPNHILIPLILRIHRHRHVPKQCLWPRRRHNQLPLRKIRRRVNHILRHTHQRIRNLPQFPLLILMHHLNIRKRRPMLRAIIHQLLPPINHPILPHLLKRLIHLRHHILIQRERQVIPRTARPQRPHLQLHIPPLLFHEIPHSRIQLIPRVLKPRMPLFLQRPLIHHPGLKPCVIRPRNIPRRASPQPIIPS